MRHDKSTFAGWDHNIYGEWDSASIDDWTSDLDEARQIASAYLARTGVAPIITRYPMRETPDGWETDTSTWERVN
jgi:hypothetical protein